MAGRAQVLIGICKTGQFRGLFPFSARRGLAQSAKWLRGDGVRHAARGAPSPASRRHLSRGPWSSATPAVAPSSSATLAAAQSGLTTFPDFAKCERKRERTETPEDRPSHRRCAASARDTSERGLERKTVYPSPVVRRAFGSSGGMSHSAVSMSPLCRCHRERTRTLRQDARVCVSAFCRNGHAGTGCARLLRLELPD
jgi:hypothetical protein